MEEKEDPKEGNNSPVENVILISGIKNTGKFKSERQAAMLITEQTKIRPIKTSITPKNELWIQVATQSDAETLLKHKWPEAIGKIEARFGRKRQQSQQPQRQLAKNQIVVTSIPLTFTTKDIFDIFGEEGYKVQNVNQIRFNNRFTGKAKVSFANHDDYKTALQTKQLQDRYCGATLKIEKYFTESKHTQCLRCFAHGHMTSVCADKMRCGKCSKIHQDEKCETTYCRNCDSKTHSPTAQNCPQRQLQVNLHYLAIQKLRGKQTSELNDNSKNSNQKQPTNEQRKAWTNPLQIVSDNEKLLNEIENLKHANEKLQNKMEAMETTINDIVTKSNFLNRKLNKLENKLSCATPVKEPQKPKSEPKQHQTEKNEPNDDDKRHEKTAENKRTKPERRVNENSKTKQNKPQKPPEKEKKRDTKPQRGSPKKTDPKQPTETAKRQSPVQTRSKTTKDDNDET